jgi:hypothetical protein
MDDVRGWPRRRFYGIAEIADAVGVDRQLVTVWRRRSSHGLPTPDEELASGPLWAAETVEPWIQVTRARLETEAATQRAVGLTPALARQAARRLFRLVALLLEEPRRADPLARAVHDLGVLHGPLAEAVAALEGSKRGLQDIVAVSRLAGRLDERQAGQSADRQTERLDDQQTERLAGRRSAVGAPGRPGEAAAPAPQSPPPAPAPASTPAATTGPALESALDDLLAACLQATPQVPKLLARAERQ